MARQRGEEIDPSALNELLEASRPQPVEETGEGMPEWFVVAELMRTYHWTERQIHEDMSLAMIFRLAWLEKIHAERDERDRRKAERDGRKNQTGNNGVAAVRPRYPAARR